MSGLRKHKVTCDTCEKTEVIEIGDNGEIPREWCYWGKLDVNFEKTTKYYYRSVDSKHFDIDDCYRVRNSKYDPQAKRKYVEEWECHECCGCDKK